MSKTPSARSLTPQTPGAPVAANAGAPEAGAQTIAGADANAQAGAVAKSTTEGADKSEETVVVSKADLSALMSRLEQLERNRVAPAAKLADPAAELPDQGSIDRNKITTAVLTKQGWVLPASADVPHPSAPRVF